MDVGTTADDAIEMVSLSLTDRLVFLSLMPDTGSDRQLQQYKLLSERLHAPQECQLPAAIVEIVRSRLRQLDGGGQMNKAHAHLYHQLSTGADHG